MFGWVTPLLDALDRIQRGHSAPAFLFAIQKKFSEDRAGNLCALIAYYGFISMFPLLLVFASVLSLALHGNPSAQKHILDSAKRDFPSLAGYVHVGALGGTGIALGIGIAAALWAGFGVTNSAQDAFNSVWGVPEVRRPNFWRARLRGLALLGLLGGVFIASTALTTLSSAVGSSPLVSALSLIGGLALNFGLYLVSFQVLTAVHVGWRELIPGAALGASLWTALEYLGSYYTRHVVAHASHLYGSFAVVIGLLAWIFLGARVTLYSAEVNVVLSLHLWPRSLRDENPTEADTKAHQWQVDKVDRRRRLMEDPPREASPARE